MKIYNWLKLPVAFSVIVTVIISLTMLYPAIANAATQADCDDDRNKTFLGLPKWYKYMETKPDDTGNCSPVLSNDVSEGSVNKVLPVGLSILEGMLRISGLVAVVMIFWAGFKYITTQGNPEAAAGARKTAINALVGLVIVILATTLVSFVGNSLVPSSATGNNSTQINRSGGIQ